MPVLEITILDSVEISFYFAEEAADDMETKM